MLCDCRPRGRLRGGSVQKKKQMGLSVYVIHGKIKDDPLIQGEEKIITFQVRSIRKELLVSCYKCLFSLLAWL